MGYSQVAHSKNHTETCRVGLSFSKAVLLNFFINNLIMINNLIITPHQNLCFLAILNYLRGYKIPLP